MDPKAPRAEPPVGYHAAAAKAVERPPKTAPQEKTAKAKAKAKSHPKETDNNPAALLQWRLILKKVLQQVNKESVESWTDVLPLEEENEVRKRGRGSA